MFAGVFPRRPGESEALAGPLRAGWKNKSKTVTLPHGDARRRGPSKPVPQAPMPRSRNSPSTSRFYGNGDRIPNETYRTFKRNYLKTNGAPRACPGRDRRLNCLGDQPGCSVEAAGGVAGGRGGDCGKLARAHLSQGAELLARPDTNTQRLPGWPPFPIFQQELES